MRSYRDEGTVKKHVLVHLGQYPSPEHALRAWPEDIAEHKEAGRDEQAERLQKKLDELRRLTRKED